MLLQGTAQKALLRNSDCVGIGRNVTLVREKRRWKEHVDSANNRRAFFAGSFGQREPWRPGTTARRMRRTGIPWRPQVADRERENCRRSSLCRAIERLEQRGLIQRVYGLKHRRTVALKLTHQGRGVAELLCG
jgi:hypothetical protein